MKYSDFISGIFWLVVGVLLSASSITYPLGSITNPGPGFLPLSLGLLLIIFSLILLGKAKKKMTPQNDKVSLPFFAGAWKKAYAISILILASFFFETIGYLLTFFLLIFLLLLGAELRNWKKNLLIAFLTALGVYLVFVLILKQPLPRGLLRI